ncbi:unnamed protein product [Amaranthus hypochondriacus]
MVFSVFNFQQISYKDILKLTMAYPHRVFLFLLFSLLLLLLLQLYFSFNKESSGVLTLKDAARVHQTAGKPMSTAGSDKKINQAGIMSLHRLHITLVLYNTLHRNDVFSHNLIKIEIASFLFP